jgi:uncharacterized phage infection (PIP) family protein YhgE
MGIADDIKNMGEDIAGSYDMRVKAIGVLVKGTHKMLNGFRREHKEMAGNLRRGLEQGESDRLNAFQSMMSDIQKGVKEIETYVENKLKEFSDAHKEMSDKLRSDLKKGETGRLKDSKSMMTGIKKAIKEIETYVANKLKEFSDAHKEMSEELRKELAKYVDDMVKATRKLMGDIQARQKERNAEVADLLEAFQTERENMAANWQSIVATMAKKRGIMPEVEVKVKVMPVKEAIKEAAKEVEEEEVSPEMKLEKKVLKFINKHPKGVKVGDMEEPLGVARTRLGVIAKRLLDEGKVRKEENLYFPL